MILVMLGFAAGTIYIFCYPSDTVFIAWCGLVGTVGGIYHWLNVHDSKVPDAVTR
jgi:hypothetical protein